MNAQSSVRNAIIKQIQLFSQPPFTHILLSRAFFASTDNILSIEQNITYRYLIKISTKTAQLQNRSQTLRGNQKGTENSCDSKLLTKCPIKAKRDKLCRDKQNSIIIIQPLAECIYRQTHAQPSKTEKQSQYLSRDFSQLLLSLVADVADAVSAM